MKTRIAPLFVAALVLAAGAPCIASTADMLSSSDEAAIKSAINDFVTAWNKHDAKAMAASWAPDADVINPAGRAAKGRAEIEKLFKEEQSTFMHASVYSIAQTDLRQLAPNVAFADISGEVANMMDPMGNAMPVFKHHVDIVLMKKDGRWWPQIIRAFAFQTPPAMPPAKG